MRTYKIKFCGFFKPFDIANNFITESIKKVGSVEMSDEPDYVFYSVFSEEYLLYPDAIRIFFTGENVAPNFQLCDYAIGFERLEFGDRYLRFPFYYGMKEYAADLSLALSKHTKIQKELLNRDFCSFVYSNTDTDMVRTKIYELLSEYKKVDSGGGLLCNIDGGPVENKLEFERKHKFSIACENSSHEGYVTEKILQSFAAKTIPIYYGDPSVVEDFNSSSFINCHNFDTLHDVVDKVKQVDQDDKLYLEMLSQPIFLHSNYHIQMQERFDLFIQNIFTQKKEDAFRRNRVFWGKKIDEKYLKIYRIEQKLKRMRKVLFWK